MLIARVAGHIVSTAKNRSYEGHKILRVIPEDWQGNPLEGASPIVALDLVDAGIGDRVLICQEGRWAREAVGDMHAPVRSMVVAVVEGIDAGAPPNELGGVTG
jgi:microcompartment protein CcmK/EutM